MAERDVEQVRDAFARMASEGFESVLPQIHPDFVMETLPGLAAEPQVYRGPEGVRLWFESFYEVMDEVRVEPDEYVDGGDGRVILGINLKARGQASGLEVTQRAYMLVGLEDELLRRIDFFFTREDALAAVS